MKNFKMKITGIKITFLLFFQVFFYVSCIAQEVVIGSQTWTTENLDVATFRNGDTIPEAKTKEEWIKAGKDGKPAWCYNDNDTLVGKKFGKLYNGYAVNDSRGLAPEGWHIPSDNEWLILTKSLGKDDVTKMKSTTGWADNTNGTNLSGFNALPAGFRGGKAESKYDKDAVFANNSTGAYWWSSTAHSSSGNWARYIYHQHKIFHKISFNNVNGFSVRCVKD